jgi:toxin YxiD
MIQIALRSKKFEKLEGAEKALHSDKYTPALRKKLISQWEKNTDQVWPKYKEDVYAKKSGRKIFDKGEPVQAHHIIHQEHGGPHAWWNIHSAEFGKVHQAGLYGKGSIGQKMHGKK